MGEKHVELLALIARIRTRWRAVTALRAWTRVAAGSFVALGLALLTQALFRPAAGPMVMLWGAALTVVVVAVVWGMASLPRAPGDALMARFIEERCPELEDSLVTAVAHGVSDTHLMSAAVMDDAIRRTREIDADRIINRQMVRRAALLALAASVAFIAMGAYSTSPVLQASRVVRLHLFPAGLDLRVAPGDIRVRAGESVRVVATLSGDDLVVPLLRLGRDGEWRETPMEKAGSEFVLTLERVEQDFRYAVKAAGAASREYAVTVIRAPRVEQIDLRYEFPAGLGMPPRDEEDGGDIYGPAGTRVRVTVHTDKPVRDAALTLTGGAPITLSASGDVLQGELTITQDGSYRVALTDADGLTNRGDTEYFIRTLQDRPPDVRIIRPASDRQVTPLEEVAIVARADDDFGIAALDLVYSTGGSREKSIPFTRSDDGATVTGRRMLYLEDLKVRPGDVVAYYARARDVNRGSRSKEARSDIFFLEVTPFEEEFVASQSQGAGGGGGNEQGLEELIQAEKDIITATWNLDRRGREAGGQSRDDIRTVARGQQDLRSRAAAMLADMQRASDRRRRLPAGRGAAPAATGDAMQEAVGRSVTAMTAASQQLDAFKTSTALPHEMTALNELLRAQAEVRRREIQQQQANGAGGPGSNRRQQDLSSLFDRELAREQETNYETPPGRESRDEQKPGNEALDKVRDLARRQDALNRSEQELAQKQASMTQEELRRELERLTREQGELRRQAEELSRELQQSQSSQGNQQNQQNQQGQRGQSQGRQASQSGQSGQGGQGGDSQQASRELQQASEDMQSAASELRRNNPGQASARGSRAADRLRDVEQQMRGSQPDDRRRALGELQLESRQLADAQRRLGNEAAAPGRGDRADRARQRATEQERLADRTARVEEAVKQLAEGARGGDDERQRNALNEAAKEAEAQRLSERMRSAARAERQAGSPQGGAESRGGREGESIARGLDRLADRLGTAAGEGQQSQELGEELARIRRLREQLTSLDRELSELRTQANSQSAGRQGGEAGRQGGEGGRQTAAQAGRQGGRGAQPGGLGQDTGADGPWQGARELLNELRQNEEIVPADADGFNPGRSAPGTEAWKQDFQKWDELKVQLAAALERAERTAADQLRGEQSRDRLSAGSSQAVPESYRRLVEKYYRSLASESGGK